MADDEQSTSELFLFRDFSGVSPGEADFVIDGQEVGVHHPRVGAGEGSIEQFEHVFAKQEVVAIDHHHDILRLTKVTGRVQNILQCHLPLLVLLDRDPPIKIGRAVSDELLDMMSCVVD